MDPQQQQYIEQELFQNWSQIRPQVTETFAQVSRADLDPAQSVTDLVQRISLKTGLPDQFIERQLQDIIQGTQGGGHQSKRQVGAQSNQSLGSSQERQQGQQERQYATTGGGRTLGG